MRPRTGNLALLLMLIASVAWSASARGYVECADGSPCPEPAAPVTPPPGCGPAPCDEHPAPAHAPCVLRVQAAPDSVAPDAPADLTDLPPALAASPQSAPAHDRAPVGATLADDHHPPPYLSPGQGHGPRAPPPRGA
jgi:hypothetical protein